MSSIHPREIPNNPQRQSASHPRPSAANHRRRGAPKGNFNALKHGRRSRRFNEIGAIVAADPTLAASILGAAGRQARTRAYAQEDVAVKLAALFHHAQSIAMKQPSRGPFLYLLSGDPADLESGVTLKNSINRMAAQAIVEREARRARRKRRN